MRSLASRLLFVIAAWLSVALLVTGILLSTLFRKNAEDNFNDLLLAHAYNLMGAIEVTEDNKLTGTPNLGDPRFLQPFSGWYWAVATAKNPGLLNIKSGSIAELKISVPTKKEVPFSKLFRRSYLVENELKQQIQRLEAQLFLGDSDVLYQVVVAGNRSKLEKAITNFNRNLFLFFLAFGLGTILATFYSIRFGLKPLNRTTESLTEIREGKQETLKGDFPKEIEPLANEINALITANKSVTERARTQVGNLAHALKTPLAVILNEANKPDKKMALRVKEQANIMQIQINTYLNRARIAAQQDTLSVHTLVAPVANSLVKVMQKLSPSVEFALVNDCPEVIFKGEQQDLEEVFGNLLENASRFASANVHVSIASPPDEQKALFSIRIEDDGPGISEKHRDEALQRGQRLDETKAGSGLGLSIVQDIASEYGGRIELGKSQFGGLCVTMYLPRTGKL